MSRTDVTKLEFYDKFLHDGMSCPRCKELMVVDYTDYDTGTNIMHFFLCPECETEYVVYYEITRMEEVE